MKIKFSIIKIIFILWPFIFWGVIVSIRYFLGFQKAFMTIFNFFLGLQYAFVSFYCASCQNKSIDFENRKDWFFEEFKYDNLEQFKIEKERRQDLYNSLSTYHLEYKSANKWLYVLQGAIAVIVSLEFLLGWT